MFVNVFLKYRGIHPNVADRYSLHLNFFFHKKYANITQGGVGFEGLPTLYRMK